jgi:hypothetical protein
VCVGTAPHRAPDPITHEEKSPFYVFAIAGFAAIGQKPPWRALRSVCENFDPRADHHAMDMLLFDGTPVLPSAVQNDEAVLKAQKETDEASLLAAKASKGLKRARTVHDGASAREQPSTRDAIKEMRKAVDKASQRLVKAKDELETARATRDAAVATALLKHQRRWRVCVGGHTRTVAARLADASERVGYPDILREWRSVCEEIVRRRNAGDDCEAHLAALRTLQKRRTEALRALDRAISS